MALVTVGFVDHLKVFRGEGVDEAFLDLIADAHAHS
jgi:hypothetical protein